MPLLVLDRDGVVNQDADDYIRSEQDWIPIPGSINAIARLSRAGYRVVIATNQSGLNRGYFTLEDLESIHSRLCAMVEEQGGSIAGIFYCPHRPDENCDCRKPATGLLRAIERELGEPVAGCYFIGDSLKDLQAGQAMSCEPVLVLTGKGMLTRDQLVDGNVDLVNPQAISVYENLHDAAEAILES
jgi:D-glycero-D-manno-heptose 1,7-bisphosphate phosphatase